MWLIINYTLFEIPNGEIGLLTIYSVETNKVNPNLQRALLSAFHALKKIGELVSHTSIIKFVFFLYCM